MYVCINVFGGHFNCCAEYTGRQLRHAATYFRTQLKVRELQWKVGIAQSHLVLIHLIEKIHCENKGHIHIGNGQKLHANLLKTFPSRSTNVSRICGFWKCTNYWVWPRCFPLSGKCSLVVAKASVNVAVYRFDWRLHIPCATATRSPDERT